MAAVEDDLKVLRTEPILREMALEKLRNAILACRFRPGDRLVERDLCNHLGVSRSIVREILRHLEAEGLVATIPFRGPIVARPDRDEALEIYAIRALLESDAAAAFAVSATNDAKSALAADLDVIVKAYATQDPLRVIATTTQFYRRLFTGGGRRVAWQLVRSLNARINLLRAMTISSPARSADGPRELALIVKAIEAGDPEAARAASVAHVESAAAIAFQLLADGSNPDRDESAKPS
jgi:DNA-binding GntR family transcriptional regulator